MGQDMEYKRTPLEIKREPDQDGRFEGYASVYNVVDDVDDAVAPGAFTKSLSERMPKMLWQHDPTQPIGKWEEVREDERGLFVKGRLFKDIQRAADAMTLIREGVVDSMSIGYRTIESAKEGAGDRVRKLLELELWEVSLVTFPANKMATITDVKSIGTEREFERFLRDAGYSRNEATAIALHGFKALVNKRDAVETEADGEGLASLNDLILKLQETIKNG